MATDEKHLKCHRCPVCNGYGCPGNLPGLGGVFENKNFQLNCEVWSKLRENPQVAAEIARLPVSPQDLRCGPVTGAVENIGYAREADFYLPYLQNAANAGIGLCVGDGCPDEKLELGLAAIQKIGKKAAFFLKPYPQEKLLRRIDLVRDSAEYIGIDIDSFNIVTMRNLVNLEKKTAAQLRKLRDYARLPFVIKGIFTSADLKLVKAVRPEVVYISNHGGRVETKIGSTGDFLREHVEELKQSCSQIWIDGGIRSKLDVQTAKYMGADKVIVARPFIRATFDNTFESVIKEFL